MKQQLKIAIFSGSIPSTTFIEKLIIGVAKTHEVQLYGVMLRATSYASKSIKIYKTPYVHLLNLIYTLYRLCVLSVKAPKAIFKLCKHIQRFPRLYDKWIWFSKFLPIILYRPDVLHIQWARDLEFYWFLKTEFDIAIVVSLRGAHINYTPIVEPYIAKLYEDCFPEVDGFHAVSEAISHEALKYKAAPQRIQVIHSPVDNAVLKYFKPYKKTNRPTLQMVSVGRFHWKKGYDYALQALSVLRGLGVDVHYTIITANTVPEAILFQINQLGLQDVVTLSKGMPQDALLQHLNAYDLMLLPSLEEGIANVVLEAMAIGLPVVSTNCGGMAEVVIPNKTGWLVPVRNPKAIADAVLEISKTSEANLKAITTAAHQMIRNEFNDETSISQFVELYKKVVVSSNGVDN